MYVRNHSRLYVWKIVRWIKLRNDSDVRNDIAWLVLNRRDECLVSYTLFVLKVNFWAYSDETLSLLMIKDTCHWPKFARDSYHKPENISSQS